MSAHNTVVKCWTGEDAYLIAAECAEGALQCDSSPRMEQSRNERCLQPPTFRDNCAHPLPARSGEGLLLGTWCCSWKQNTNLI